MLKLMLCWLKGLRLGALHGGFFNTVLALLEPSGSKPLCHMPFSIWFSNI
jgi:hypothetical protein